jgi:hypothetical protein
MQLVQVKVKGKHGKSSIVFVDLGDYEKVQSNILDHQKILEMVLYNNSLTGLSNLLSGLKHGTSNLSNAPFKACKLT